MDNADSVRDANGSAALRQRLGSFFDIARIHARGKGSGMEIEQTAAHLLTFDGARVRRLETFADSAAARAAL